MWIVKIVIHLRHAYDGPRYVYAPIVSRPIAQKSALKQMVRTFFDGSTSQAVAALLDMSAKDLSEDELERLAELVEQARRDYRVRLTTPQAILAPLLPAGCEI